jgi:hypothetical protein
LAFDIVSLVWIHLDADLTEGEWPVPRASPGFASMDGKLYVFGGVLHAGGFIETDLHLVMISRLIFFSELVYQVIHLHSCLQLFSTTFIALTP